MKELVTIHNIKLVFSDKSKHSMTVKENYSISINDDEFVKITSCLSLDTIIKMINDCKNENEVFEFCNMLVKEDFNKSLLHFIGKYNVSCKQLDSYNYEFSNNNYKFILSSYQMVDIIELKRNYTIEQIYNLYK